MTAYVAAQATYTCVYAGDDPVNEGDPTGLGCSLWEWALSPTSCALQHVFFSEIQSMAKARLHAAVALASSAMPNLEQQSADITTETCVSAAEESSTWARWPDWFGFNVSGTWLLPFAEAVPVLATFTFGGQITVDRYGDVFIGAQGGVSGPGYQGTVAAGWIFDAHVPSRADLRGFISSWSITGSVVWGTGPGAGASLVWGDVDQFNAHAFGLQLDAGFVAGRGAALQVSYDWYMGNIGLHW